MLRGGVGVELAARLATGQRWVDWSPHLGKPASAGFLSGVSEFFECGSWWAERCFAGLVMKNFIYIVYKLCYNE